MSSDSSPLGPRTQRDTAAGNSNGNHPPRSGAYGPPFWFAYVANTCMMVAMSLLFRYADLVTVLGGDEFELGWILGVGMVGSLVMRVAQGVGIDRYGAGRIWVLSTIGFSIACAFHVGLTTVHGPAIYLLRVAFCTAVAGAFGGSITYISSRVPVVRVAEVIGTLGTSGFIGMMAGTLLGDFMHGPGQVVRDNVDRMFLTAAGLGMVSAAFAMLATRGHVNGARRRKVPVWAVLRRYHPGPLLLVGIAVGIGVGMPGNYLRPYTAELNIGGIALFFWIYAPTAFLVRMIIRRWPERYGIRPMVCLGLGHLAASMCLYLVVRSQPLLAAPALVAGVAHAFLFPSVVGGGSTAFPPRYRGLGVTLMLTMVDFGNLVGAPMAGLILDTARREGVTPYPVMFLTMAFLLGAMCAYYAFVTRRTSSRRGTKPEKGTDNQRIESDKSYVTESAELCRTSGDS